jgi:aminopeptidase N
MSKKINHLYDRFKPVKYQIELKVDKRNKTFSGNVIIQGNQTGPPSKRLTLHQKGLNIGPAKIFKLGKKPSDRNELSISRVNTQKKLDELRLHTADKVYAGQYELQIAFSGTISNTMHGIYLCKHNQNGEEKQIVATQFESHYAREAFPCIDEPQAKAEFDLTIITPEDELVLSNNTVLKESIDQSGNKKTSFKTTPKMSTYLLAFIIGDLEHKELTTKNGTLLRAYATPNNVDKVDFALDIASKSLELFEDYFEIKYPLEKCDFIALPDFASGAMENWGCITFREQSMLVDDKTTSLSSKQYIATTVAHELAHQWFGNLVTMKWWTDLWLNEGFASWVAFFAIDKIYPEWHMWTQFVIEEQHSALKLDTLRNTHPVEVPINHPDEIRSIFDAISYEKGASLIHMLHSYLGPELFKKGLAGYLKTHEYGNTVTKDLWDSLEKVSKKPVGEFMGKWTSQSGYPLVKASQTSKQALHLSQERFNDSGSSVIWPAPILNSSIKQTTLDDKESEVNISLKKPVRLKINKDQGAFYRTIYDQQLLKKIIHTDNYQLLSPLDKVGLLADIAEASRLGYSSSVEALILLEKLHQESDYVIWDTIITTLSSLKNAMNNETFNELLNPYVIEISAKELSRLGWDDSPSESHFDQLLRPGIIAINAGAKNTEVINKCKELFDKVQFKEAYKAKNNPILPSQRSIVYSSVVRHSKNEKAYEKLIKMHQKTDSSEERLNITAGVTSSKNPEVIKQVLDYITTDNVRLQDTTYWIAYSLANKHSKKPTWEWLKSHWEWLTKNLGEDLSFYRMPLYVARAFKSKDELEEYIEFFKPLITPAMERSYNQGLELIDYQIKWRERDYDKVSEYLQNRKSS